MNKRLHKCECEYAMVSRDNFQNCPTICDEDFFCETKPKKKNK